ncbi:hypothetical protein [Nocardioides sp.]|uniref:hypothetical protein n=1 Tax=Nocardioides sp. TaxID=35761 RepID=UPI003D12F055
MDRHDPSAQDGTPRTHTGRVLGWASGLALLIFPWIGAGILATVVTFVGPDDWDPESTFPWLLLAAFSTGVGWIIYGSVSIPGFRRGAIPGTAIALTTIAGIYLVGVMVTK